MNKGLEALKEIKNYKEWTTVADIIGFKKEKVKLAYNDKLKILFTIIEKELKALEIIKNKYLNPHDFILCCCTMNNKKWLSYEEYKKSYMNYYEDDEYLLIQEEYDLLKEVLL